VKKKKLVLQHKRNHGTIIREKPERDRSDRTGAVTRKKAAEAESTLEAKETIEENKKGTNGRPWGEKGKFRGLHPQGKEEDFVRKRGEQLSFSLKGNPGKKDGGTNRSWRTSEEKGGNFYQLYTKRRKKGQACRGESPIIPVGGGKKKKKESYYRKKGGCWKKKIKSDRKGGI